MRSPVTERMGVLGLMVASSLRGNSLRSCRLRDFAGRDLPTAIGLVHHLEVQRHQLRQGTAGSLLEL